MLQIGMNYLLGILILKRWKFVIMKYLKTDIIIAGDVFNENIVNFKIECYL